ncbi:hypothetical protein TNIN_257701 [Trichonephila inaurata madagascariensis]|uniref:Uncharacterized protein n=1 Tax=Trichonephila inaurata madagascariensis TaxID=2747483 RepID=A0A8X6MK02_9ARAC|nr:hypothetical protein TNIN_257701 [Trichonephila inaurata madagascariensis]
MTWVLKPVISEEKFRGRWEIARLSSRSDFEGLGIPVTVSRFAGSNFRLLWRKSQNFRYNTHDRRSKRGAQSIMVPIR